MPCYHTTRLPLFSFHVPNKGTGLGFAVSLTFLEFESTKESQLPFILTKFHISNKHTLIRKGRLLCRVFKKFVEKLRLILCFH